MAFQLEWFIEGEKQLSRVISDIKTDTKQLGPAFKKSGEHLRRTFERDVFKTRGAEIGERWAPLSPVTIARKSLKGYPSTPLIATGRMKRSFRSYARTDMAAVYNTADYFKYHQSNQPRSSRLPRRVMMKLGINQREDVVKIFHTHIYKTLTKRS